LNNFHFDEGFKELRFGSMSSILKKIEEMEKQGERERERLGRKLSFGERKSNELKRKYEILTSRSEALCTIQMAAKTMREKRKYKFENGTCFHLEDFSFLWFCTLGTGKTETSSR
jgi:hypothetical protein